MIGIYCIENKVNHKCYIGQSIDIECRWRQHKNNYLVLDLPLYLDMRKYGLESFSFNIVCECTKDDLTTYEFAAMQRYILNGYTLYNIITPISTSIKITEDVIMNIISLLKECEMSHSDIAVDCGVSVEVVDGINTGRLYRLPYIDYPIVDYKLLSEEHLRILKTCPICGNLKDKTSNRCLSCYLKDKEKNIPSRNIVKYLIRNYSFESIGRMYGVSGNAVKKWCDKYNLPKFKSVIKKLTDEQWYYI